VTGNVTGGNLNTAGTVNATGNVRGGNLVSNAAVTATTVTATGNVTGGNILGNGAGLSGINVFSNISVSGGNSVVADSISDTLTLVAGSGITITANATADTITFAASGGGGGTPGGSNTQVQFNDGGSFGGTAGFTFDKVTNAVSTSGSVAAGFFSNPKTIQSVVQTAANTNNLLIGPVTVANIGNIIVDDTSTLTVL
jgi:hypothetical protein